MKIETTVILSIGIIAAALTAYSISKEKPYIASAILGSFSVLGLIYTLMREREV